MREVREVRAFTQVKERKSNFKEYTVFVDNLPEDLDQYGLKGIFKKAGQVSDTYIPRRRSGRKAHRFGFVRFNSLNETARSISMLNGSIIRRKRIRVSMAKYERTERRKGRGKYMPQTRWNQKKLKKVWQRKGSHEQNTVHIDQGCTIEAHKIIGEQCTATMEWLQRSISCQAREPMDGIAMHTELVSKKGMQVQIRMLSCMQIILTFPSEQLIEECLRQRDELGQWFSSIEKWSITDKAEYRRTWVEVFGVPVHRWTKENFQKIAEVWGRLISLDSLDDPITNYESMKLLIATDHFYRIEGDVLFQIGSAGYRVVVTEVGAVLPKDSPCMGASIQKGQDIAVTHERATDEAVQRNNPVSKNGANQVGLTDENEVEVVQESNFMGSNSQLGNKQQTCLEVQRVGEIQNLKVEPNQVSPITSSAGSDHSVTKTKSLGCSHNECMKEALINKVGQEQCASPIHIQTNSAGGNEKALRGVANQTSQGSIDNSSPSGPPPGFELESRYNKVVPDHIPLSVASNLSLDSAEKRAKEALQIGNLLGLKIIHNAKVAEDRITRTLRSHSKKLQQEAVKSPAPKRKTKGL